MPDVRVLNQRQGKARLRRGDRERINQAILSLPRESQRHRLRVGFPDGDQHAVVSVHESNQPLRRGQVELVAALHFLGRVNDVRAHERRQQAITQMAILDLKLRDVVGGHADQTFRCEPGGVGAVSLLGTDAKALSILRR